MTKTINPERLKAAAEHLEWVLRQYPGIKDIQELLQSLSPLIKDAKAGRVSLPIERQDVPGAYSFSDGAFIPYSNPSVGSAYTEFRIELRGGLTDKEKKNIEQLEEMRRRFNNE
ncbi:hypothetical protein [Solilutibacter pythonis]|uniref:hypothetical protein n=1 Tax=Solilutibacter pythonis TaxID=2483112 RepID=UPI0011C41344|nr:hypothetical protein [Lysobacter pythonis]